MSDLTAQLQQWVPWSELTGTKRGTRGELRALLRKYSRSSLFMACARLGIGFQYGPAAETASNAETTVRWARLLLPAPLARKAIIYARQGRVIFFEGQIKLLAAEVMRLDLSPTDGISPVPDEALGELLLRSGEALYDPAQKVSGELENLANLIALFLPYYELNPPGDSIMHFLRFYIFLKINIGRLPASIRNLYDIDEMFLAEFGFPLRRYAHFIFSFINHALQERTRFLEGHGIDGALRKSWFRGTTLEKNQIEKMFAAVAFGLKDLPDTKPSVGFADFEKLRDCPYFETAEELYCIDYGYAVSKLESGALWRLLRKQPEKKKKTYLGFWGHVFEDYVAWLFETYANKMLNELYPSPRYETDKHKEMCDGVVICGSKAVLIEAKLGTCPANVRYANDYKAMQGVIEEKLVGGAGVVQLLTAIDNLTTLPESALPVALRGGKKLIPLIVTKDEMGSSWAINSYLNKRFQDQLKEECTRRYEITPLVCMSISTLERSMRALADHSLSEIIERRIQADPSLKKPFESACEFISAGPALGMFKHVEIMESLGKDVVADFGITE